ncbi:MAG: hypothetical protein IT385_06810 [Deltaproteobacteria bacterium]|nr:hypothetical protein [Deltaproteobacteria bacterium]
MSTLARLTLGLFTTFALVACGAPMGAGPGANPYYQPGDPGGPGASETSAPSCDKRKCADYCWAASCVFDEVGTGAKCMAVCESRCGDGFFDDTDAKQIDCAIRAGVSLMCDGPKACCEEHLTNQVCGE